MRKPQSVNFAGVLPKTSKRATTSIPPKSSMPRAPAPPAYKERQPGDHLNEAT